jgi:hypothetical protein
VSAGGLQLIISGDYFQLPPVSKRWVRREQPHSLLWARTSCFCWLAVSYSSHGMVAAPSWQGHQLWAVVDCTAHCTAGNQRILTATWMLLSCAFCHHSFVRKGSLLACLHGCPHGCLHLCSLPGCPPPPPPVCPQEPSMAGDLFLNTGLLFQAPSYRKCNFQHVLLTKVCHLSRGCTWLLSWWRPRDDAGSCTCAVPGQCVHWLKAAHQCGSSADCLTSLEWIV